MTIDLVKTVFVLTNKAMSTMLCLLSFHKNQVSLCVKNVLYKYRPIHKLVSQENPKKPLST